MIDIVFVIVEAPEGGYVTRAASGAARLFGR
jgi:hypothetical protein